MFQQEVRGLFGMMCMQVCRGKTSSYQNKCFYINPGLHDCVVPLITLTINSNTFNFLPTLGKVYSGVKPMIF